MRYALPLTLAATPALAHPGAIHTHAALSDWLALAGILAAMAAPVAVRAAVRRLGK